MSGKGGGSGKAPVAKNVKGKAEQAFGEMKKRIATLPMLTAPKPKELLIIIVARSKKVAKILPGSFVSHHHGSTDQANPIKAKEFMKDGKVGSRDNRA
ncbi:hypothetical protein Tco_1156948 [Tanacetum coccineum]